MAEARPDAAEPAEAFVPKRGRPNPAQVAAIERSIVSVAKALFLENGYAQTSMDAIASSAGVSKGTLYARYSGKADLFRAIVADRLAAWERMEPLSRADRGVPMTERLARFGASFLQGLRIPEVVAFEHLVSREADRFPELVLEFREQAYGKLIDGLTADLAADAPAPHGRDVAEAFVSALSGWFRSENMVREVSPADCAAYAARLAAIFVTGRESW